MAKHIINFHITGPIVQCGCFKGGSTAKLPLLAKRTQRRLYVCDSFQALPVPNSEDELFLNGHDAYPSYTFSVGDYKGVLEEVMENVKRYGCIEG